MKINSNADTVIVLDFETTGLSPDYGDRVIEIGAVKLVDGQVIDRFQKLMYPGRRIDSFIENYTGITNAMLKKAEPCAKVMLKFADYINGFNLVAHNASFDSRFLNSELQLIKRKKRSNQEEFVCSMLTARRVYPDAPNHQLGTLVRYKDLPNDGTFHRALADAEMTAHLWLTMLGDIKKNYSFENIPFEVMQKLARTSKKAASGFLTRQSSKIG